MKLPIKRNGYFYGAHTKQGFLRMQRMGIPQPPFQLENKITKYLTTVYRDALKEMLSDFVANARQVITTDNAMTTDDMFGGIINFFKKISEYASQDPSFRLTALMQLLGAITNVRQKWSENEPQVHDIYKMKDFLDEDTISFFEKFNADADDSILSILSNFTIDKQKLFDDRLEDLKTLYLNNTKERIQQGLSYQKERFLKALTDYAENKTETLDIKDIVDDLDDSTETMARFFARDQMARFNKAVTISTFLSAGVTKVRWVTCRDARVRDTHKALDGKIFDIADLPEEVNDYNCRCGLVPVEYE